ncbi:hypothetical protein [Clostridium sp.]|uniref:hypothetical protein n=1 Tax=Clostridium sp. TaxID=1506 RepID=UPI00290CC45A|nr:hypothetical protein [Clostridium sp.]MDU3410159.1 hypothetical protein [Clostridium sp.]
MSSKGIHFCALCYSSKDIEKHHSVFKSEVRSLSHCKMNYIYLCHCCHTNLHRHKGGELDQKVKMMFQNRLEEKVLKHYITYDEIKEILDISDTATHNLAHNMVRYKEGFSRENLINTCIGRDLM